MSYTSRITDDVVRICWNNTVLMSANKEYINMYQVFDFIQELQVFLSVKTLLNMEELQMLKDMAERSPTSKLHKVELSKFLSKLVLAPNLEVFLRERSGITSLELQRMIRNHERSRIYDDSIRHQASFRKPLSPYSTERASKRDFPTKPINSAPLYNDLTDKTNYSSRRNPTSTRNDFKSIISPPISPVKLSSRLRSRDATETNVFNNNRELNELRRLLKIKDQQINEREKQIEMISDENSRLSLENRRQKSKLMEFDNNKLNLTKYIEALESQLENKRYNKNPNDQNERLMIKELINKNSQQEIWIKELEIVCEKYQGDIKKFTKQDESNQKLTLELNQSLIRQKDLIDGLKAKLELKPSFNNGKSEKLEKFLRNLPFIKQFYIYHKYQREHKNFGMIFINSITLLFTTIIILNMFKLLLYITVSFKTIGGNNDNLLDYVYEEEKRSIWSTEYSEPKIEGWKQIPWLEYIAYRIQDWLYE